MYSTFALGGTNPRAATLLSTHKVHLLRTLFLTQQKKRTPLFVYIWTPTETFYFPYSGARTAFLVIFAVIFAVNTFLLIWSKPGLVMAAILIPFDLKRNE